MRISFSRFLLFTSAFIITSCIAKNPARHSNSVSQSKKVGTSIDGKYLVDDVFFPQDTLVLRKMLPSDSTTQKKLLVELKNDSIYLSNYNFGGWYGKWFCAFHKGGVRYENQHLFIHAEIDSPFYQHCHSNKKAWQKIDYQLISSTESSFIFLKISDTSNCQLKRTKEHDALGRGSRDLQILPRGDIQLR